MNECSSSSIHVERSIINEFTKVSSRIVGDARGDSASRCIDRFTNFSHIDGRGKALMMGVSHTGAFFGNATVYVWRAVVRVESLKKKRKLILAR